MRPDFIPPAPCPGKKENPKYDHPLTLLIKTIYDDKYEITDVFDYGYNANSEHYWYTTINEKHLQNYVRARTVLYFGQKECAIKEIIE